MDHSHPPQADDGLPRSVFFIGATYVILAVVTSLVLGRFIYWDDWVVIGVRPEWVIERFLQAGTPFAWTGWLLTTVNDALIPVSRLSTQALWLLTCGLFARIVYRNVKSAPIAALVGLVALIAPLNSARVAVINMPAMLCVTLFFVGWLSIHRRAWLATPAFLLSFTLPSLLFLFAAPFVERCWHAWNTSEWRKPTVAVQLVLYALLPPGYWLAKSIWWAPRGIYQGYNTETSLANVKWAGELVVDDAQHIAQHLAPAWYLALALVTVLAWPIARSLTRSLQSTRESKEARGTRWPLWLALCGVAMLVLAVLPYLLVGNPPRWAVWDSRNQALVPFAFALLLAALLVWLPRRSAAAVMALCLSVGLLHWAGQTYVIWRDGLKQEAIQRLWAAEPAVRDAHIIMLDDRSGIPFANRRNPGWYELSGLLADAFGNERRIAIEAPQWTNHLCQAKEHFRFRTPYYRTGDTMEAFPSSPQDLNIVRTVLTDESGSRRWWKRLLKPTVGLRMTAQREFDHCPSKAPEAGG